MVSGLLFLFYTYLESRWIKINEFDFISHHVPTEFHRLKIVFISDIHHGPYFSIKRVAKLVKSINEINPDLVIFGGDYVHRDAKYIKPVFDELSKINSSIGMYGVLGNHDYWEGRVETEKCMQNANIQDIVNKSKWIKHQHDSIKIGGVGDLCEDIQLIDSTIQDVNISNFCLLVSHNPGYSEQISSNKIDLILSGHTHGGQISLFGFFSPILPSKYGQKYGYGLKKMEKFSIYITSGIGTITPPLRFFMRPEIVLINLIKAEKK